MSDRSDSVTVTDGSAAAAADPVITFTDVSKTFGETRALKNVSLSVNPGEVLALLGENGSGKSTLIKVLAGYHLPDPGASVEVRGEPLSLGTVAASHAAGLRFVHQHLALITEFNAVENMALDMGYTRPGFIDWKAQARVTERLLARLGVEMDIWRPLAQCRAVERSAVAIARALNTREGDVTAVVLDEPTASLPEPEVDQLFRVIRELTNSGVAVLYVTHRLGEVFQIADRIAVLRDGVHQGTFPRSGLTRDRLVSLIVGQELTEDYESRRGANVAANVADGSDDEPLLRVEGLTAGVLQNVSFSVGTGEMLGIVGLAGSGREEVARALTGAAPVEAANIFLRGQEIEKINPRRSRDNGIVLALSNTQVGSAVREFRVRENITLGSLRRYLTRLLTFSRIREKDDTAGWIESLDIRPRDGERAYGLLSGGNQQKVILGRCLNTEPALLVLDEPTAGVDVGARAALYGLLADRAAAGIGVIVCSSDMEDVISTCRRALVMRNGRIVAELRAPLDERQMLTLAAHDADEPVIGLSRTTS